MGSTQQRLKNFRTNRKRINHEQIAKTGNPIGSEATEMANRVLAKQHMKRFRQRWGGMEARAFGRSDLNTNSAGWTERSPRWPRD